MGWSRNKVSLRERGDGSPPFYGERKNELKKKVKNNLIKLFIIVILLIVGIILIKDYKYKQTYEYKLLNLNYSKEEIKVLLDNLNSDKIDELLTKEYNKDIVSIINFSIINIS